MKIAIVSEGNGLAAYFSGELTFKNIPVDEESTLYPVPPDAHDIHVWQDGIEKSRTWSNDRYPTVLPEHPEIPMIEWIGPFPENGSVFRVDYVHSLYTYQREHGHLTIIYSKLIGFPKPFNAIVWSISLYYNACKFCFFSKINCSRKV